MTGRELRERREEIELSEQRLAEYLGVNERTIITWENSEVACPQFPLMLELAMEMVNYEETRSTDEERALLQQRIDEAIGRGEARRSDRAG